MNHFINMTWEDNLCRPLCNLIEKRYHERASLDTVKPRTALLSGDPAYHGHRTTSQNFQLPYNFCEVDLYIAVTLCTVTLPFPKGDRSTQVWSYWCFARWWICRLGVWYRCAFIESWHQVCEYRVSVERGHQLFLFLLTSITKVWMHVAHRPPKSRFLKLIFCWNKQP